MSVELKARSKDTMDASGDTLLQHILNAKGTTTPWWKTSGFKAFGMYISCLFLGTILYTYVFNDDITFTEGMYFVTATLTTVGYGDFAPEGHHEKIFTIFYVFLGFRMFTYVLGAVSHYYVTKLEQFERTEREAKGAKVVTALRRGFSRLSSVKSKITEAADDDKVAMLWSLCLELLTVCAPFIIGVIMVALLESNVEGDDDRIHGKWEFYESFYYAVVTATTVGYGDQTPQEQSSQILATIYIPYLVVTLMAAIVGVECVLENYRKKKEIDRFDVMKALENIPSLKGQLSKTEFAVFMLHHIGKINRDDLCEVIGHFELLRDKETGMISIDGTTSSALCGTTNAIIQGSHIEDEHDALPLCNF